MLKDYYFNNLSESEQQVYKRLRYGFKMGLNSITVPAAPNEKVIMAIQMEHPEFYHCDLRNLVWVEGINECTVQLKYLVKQDTIDRLEHTVLGIVNAAPAEEEKAARFLHNKLVRKVKYDFATISSDQYSHSSHSIIGPFLRNSAVCDGIALAYKRLLDEVGIDNTVLTGKLRGDARSIKHMWNVVSINGEPYYIDVTQDIATTDPRWDKPSYMYYMLTEDELLETHVPDTSFGCNAINDNPFDKLGKRRENKKALKHFLINAPEKKKLIYFKCKSIPEQEVMRIFQESLPNGIYHSFSMTHNAGRYYFYKEI